MDRKRDLTIDLIKGMGIFLMVYRHTRAPFSEIILLFHMAVFFISSGYLYNSSKINNIQGLFNFIKRKVKSLWLPYFLFTVIFNLLNNTFISLNIYTDNPEFLLLPNAKYLELKHFFSKGQIVKEIIKAVFFQSNTQIGGALWFFGTLFYSIVLYAIVDYFLRVILKIKKTMLWQGILSVLLLICGYICSILELNLFGFARVLSVYYLIYLGYFIRQKQTMTLLNKNYKYIVCTLICCVMISLGSWFGSISVVENKYVNPIFFIIMSISGWCVLWCLAKFFIRYNFFTNNALAYLSKHSVSVIGLHFLCFKTVNFIIVSIYNFELYRIAEFPVLTDSGFWFIAYILAGIGIPLILQWIYHKFADKINMHIKKLKETGHKPKYLA